MYQRFNNQRYPNQWMGRPSYSNNNRLFGGGFVVPFVLGGITGSLLNSQRPNYYYPPYPTFYNNNYFYPYPYPYY